MNSSFEQNGSHFELAFGLFIQQVFIQIASLPAKGSFRCCIAKAKSVFQNLHHQCRKVMCVYGFMLQCICWCTVGEGCRKEHPGEGRSYEGRSCSFASRVVININITFNRPFYVIHSVGSKVSKCVYIYVKIRIHVQLYVCIFVLHSKIGKEGSMAGRINSRRQGCSNNRQARVRTLESHWKVLKEDLAYFKNLWLIQKEKGRKLYCSLNE